MHTSHHQQLQEANQSFPPFDAVYFASAEGRKLEEIKPIFVEAWWNEQTALWPNKKPFRSLIMLTAIRNNLQPVRIYTMRLEVHANRIINRQIRDEACEDAVNVHLRPPEHFPSVYQHHQSKLPDDWKTFLAVALDEPVETFSRLPLLIGGPLAMSKSANISIYDATKYMAQE